MNMEVEDGCKIYIIPSQCNLSFGMRAATPSALLTALAKKGEEGKAERIKVFYMRCGGETRGFNQDGTQFISFKRTILLYMRGFAPSYDIKK